MGTPEFAVPALDALHGAGHQVVAAYTRAPQPAGRGKALRKSPVHQRAEALEIAVETPRTLRDAEAQARLAAYGADVAVVAAYGLILPQPVLDTPARGCINIHGSLLPRWRGAAPIQRAILAGDRETGITIMQMEAGLDTGPMLLAEAMAVGAHTAGTLAAALAKMGARLLLRALAEAPEPVAQPDAGVTYAAKISKEEARIDWTAPAAAIERAVRAFNPAPGAFTEVAGERLKILAAEIVPGKAPPGVVADAGLAIGTGEGLLRPSLVQRAGKPAMQTAELLRGWQIEPGTRLG